jgi:L-lactate dehydrogenase complex protein LldG
VDAREAILAAVRSRTAAEAPLTRVPPPRIADLRASFIMKARASHASLHELADISEVPEAVLAHLAGVNAVARLYLPVGSPLRDLPWSRAPNLELSERVPSGEETALSEADFGMAETGTLVFAAGRARPSSWHFLPGREIVLLPATKLRATMEEVFGELDAGGALPSTVNLVTGPSRTADIEQTIERGAHGPRDVHILLIG